MSSIWASRQGCSYQDKLSCLFFLESFRQRTLKEVYTDLPIHPKRQLSADVLLLKEKGGVVERHVYEVKTGANFKKSSSQFKGVVANFLEISEFHPYDRGFICYSRDGLSSKMIKYKDSAAMLHRSDRLSGYTKNAAMYLKTELNMSRLSSLKSVRQFFKKVKFEEQSYDNSDTWTKLDEHIAAEICEIAKECELNYNSSVLPEEYLASRLLYIIQKHAGSGKGIFGELVIEVKAFLYRREMLKHYRTNRTPNELEESAKKRIDDLMSKKFLPPTTIIELPLPTNFDDPMQGKVVSEDG